MTLRDDLDKIRMEPMVFARGFPPCAERLTIAEAIDRGYRLHDDLSTPIAVLDASALEHNLRTMAEWCAMTGLQLQPHGKTTMAPQLYFRQIELGASGITAATPAQVRFIRTFGVKKIQLANELVQSREATWLAEQMAEEVELDVTTWVDTAEGADILQRAGATAGVRMPVLLELGTSGGRTGCRGFESAVELAGRVARSDHLRLAGVAGYEGSVAGDRESASLEAVRGYLSELRRLAEGLASAGFFMETTRPIVSIGGSMFVDLIAAEWQLEHGGCNSFEIVLRSGGYIAHDHGMYARASPWDRIGTPLLPALTVWTTVISIQDGMAYLDAGRRDMSFDHGLPTPLVGHRENSCHRIPLTGAEVVALNDHHTFMHLSSGMDVEVGDRIQLGISHPCTTFDKWRWIPVLDGEVVIDVIRTFF